MSDLTLQEQESVLKTKKIFDNAVSLSNIIELTVSIISNIAGKDIADTINKESINRAVLSNIVSNRIKEKLINKE